jgi:hypothetical protein
MSYKKCNKCNENKVYGLFGRDSSKKDGFRTICKSCSSESKKKSYKENRDVILIKQKKVYNSNKEYYLEYARNNREKNKEFNKEYMAVWREKNPDKINQYNKSKYHENPEHSKLRVKEWKSLNYEYCKKYSRDYINKRLNEDFIFKIKHNTRTLVRGSFKRSSRNKYVKSNKTEEILCCDMDFFIKHISNLFVDGMSLENHGEWHLDHIIPLASANTEDEIIKLNHYTNFQPLWAADNMSKGKKIL